MREIKIERTLPVNARVNVVSLVNVNRYFKSIGYRARSMSQLVNWAVEALEEVVIDKVGNKGMVDSLSKALAELRAEGLMQRTTETRGRAKMSYGLTAENLRVGKRDPQMVMKKRYKEVHGKNEGYEEIDHQLASGQLLATPEEVRHRINEVRRKKEEVKKLKEQAIAAAKSQGLIKVSETDSSDDNEVVENEVVETSNVPTVSEKMTDDEYERKCSEISKRDEEQRRLESELLSPERLRQLAGTTSRDNNEDGE